METLEHELAVSPTEETIELEKKIRSGAPLLQAAGQKGVRGYELREKLGQGSYGQVFAASQSATGRVVAVKVILPQYANNPDFIRRFESEAQTVARLEHPFIVPLYDYWREPDGAFLVTRLLMGGSLEKSIETGPLDLARAVALVDQLSSGLYAAHQHSLLHLRLKPSNILLDDDGHAYLSDLAISPDGEHVATGGSIIKIWERATGREIMELSGHKSSITGLDFSDDGKYLASASVDKTARLWDANTGELVQEFTSPGGPLHHALFSPDGKYLLASGAGFVYGYILDQEELVNLAYERITRWFTVEECLQYLHRETCPEPPAGSRFAAGAP